MAREKDWDADFSTSKGYEDYLNAHRNSDVDNERESLHHTLGLGATQAAPGNSVKDLIDRMLALEKSQTRTADNSYTGNVTTDDPNYAKAAAFNLVDFRLNRRGNFVNFYCRLTRTSSLAFPADGDISNFTFGVVGPKWRPLFPTAMTSHNFGRTMSAVLNTDGTTVFTSAGNGTSMATGDAISFQTNYYSIADL